LKQKVDAAVIMVTHDQAEAMTLADRIVVMNDRCIQQVGAPMEIYSRPANTFVAQFVGSPAMTLANVELIEGDGPARVKLGDGSIVQTAVPRAGLPGSELRIGLRPEAVRVAASAPTTKAKVELVERLGERSLVYAHLGDGQPITAEDDAYSRLSLGDEVGLAIDGATAHLFGPDGTGYHRAAA
jgi:multiple sugar transport system ATP-binding protein